MQRSAFILFSLLLPLLLKGYCCASGKIDPAQIHEAFLSKESDALIVEEVWQCPPDAIEEDVPRQTDPRSVWVPGYWAFYDSHFTWVSGFWRRPPPGRIWISGYWQHLGACWVWYQGFWSPVEESELIYISQTPLQNKDEPVPLPPGVNCYWRNGYWYWNQLIQEYEWCRGEWCSFDLMWVETHSRYVWREKGYIFVPGYFDWPIDNRGTPYACINGDMCEIAPQHALTVAYPYWPDYISVYHHHFHFHPEFWNDLSLAAPWWSWETGWSYYWYDMWWVWWWWSHPGYPHPYWITAAHSTRLAPPQEKVLLKMQDVRAPIIVSARGVVSPFVLSKVLREENPVHLPLMPFDQSVKGNLQMRALSEFTPSEPYLRPQESLKLERFDKPHFGSKKAIEAEREKKWLSPDLRPPTYKPPYRGPVRPTIPSAPASQWPRPDVPVPGPEGYQLPPGFSGPRPIPSIPPGTKIVVPKVQIHPSPPAQILPPPPAPPQPIIPETVIPTAPESHPAHPAVEFHPSNNVPPPPTVPPPSDEPRFPYKHPRYIQGTTSYQGRVPMIYKPTPMQLQDRGDYMSNPQPQYNPGPSSFYAYPPYIPGNTYPSRGRNYILD